MQYGIIIMTNRVCSYCRSSINYDNDGKQSNGHWYSLVIGDRRCLYFLCNNCYLKQIIKNTQRVHVRWQNRKEIDIKQRISKLKTSLMQL